MIDKTGLALIILLDVKIDSSTFNLLVNESIL